MKMFVFALLAIAAVSAEPTCEPGESFKYYCNNCNCGPDGLVKSAACTRIGCDPSVWNEDGTVKKPLSDPVPREKRQADAGEATCEPGKPFKYYCNNCRCGADGLVKSAACTKMACLDGIFNRDGSLKQPPSDPIPRETRQAGGTIATCVPGKNFKLYCNTCYCPDSGDRSKAACTLIGCPNGVYNEDGTLVKPDSTPRNKRQADGAGATCSPGTSFKHFCNSCQCPTNGDRNMAACTRKGCPDGVYNEDGTLVNSADGAGGAEATCVPGTSFNHFCNTCRCGPDGLLKSASCTRVGCLDGMYNENGSYKGTAE